jgi:hypothetical protein
VDVAAVIVGTDPPSLCVLIAIIPEIYFALTESVTFGSKTASQTVLFPLPEPAGVLW